MKYTPSSGFAAALAAAFILAACDIPTEAPKWYTEWAVPTTELVVSVDSLLPAGVTVAPDGAAFLVELQGVQFSRTLAEMCGSACPAGSATVPKPAFADSFATAMELPAEVYAVEVAGGAMSYTLHNGLSFDPIRPPGASTNGRVRIRVRSGSLVLAEIGVDGAVEPWPAGSTLAGGLEFGTGTVEQSLAVEFLLDSPAGSAVTMTSTDQVGINVLPGSIRVASATVHMEAEPVSSSGSMTLDMDEGVTDRVHGGSVVLRIQNGLGAAGTFQLHITGEDVQLVRDFAAPAGESVQTLALTAGELRAILGGEATFALSGTISAPSNRLTVTPGQELRVRTELRLVVGPAEEDS
jgi:hypothetical protein